MFYIISKVPDKHDSLNMGLGRWLLYRLNVLNANIQDTVRGLIFEEAYNLHSYIL